MIYITTKQTEREVTKMEKLVDLYIDVDDVILNTSETFIDYYTKKKNIHKSFGEKEKCSLILPYQRAKKKEKLTKITTIIVPHQGGKINDFI